MKLKPFYNTEAEIPAELKAYYVQVGEKWELDGGEETVGAYYNASLDAKKKEIKEEKDREKTAKEAAQRENQRLTTVEIPKLQNDLQAAKNEAQALKAPGMKSIPEAEVKELENFRTIGPLKEVKDKVKLADEFQAVVKETLGEDKKPEDVKTALAAKATLEQENATHKRDEILREAAEKSEFNFGVLRDLITHPERGAGIDSIVVKDVTVEGKPTRQAFAILKPETEGGSKVEKPLTEYATGRTDWQSYLGALKLEDNGGGTRILGGGPSRTDKGPETEVDKLPDTFNAARDTRKSPFGGAPAKTAAGAGA